MRKLLPLLLFLGCATSPSQSVQRPCARFEGLYTFDPAQCRVSRGVLPLNLVYEQFPDGSPLPYEPVLVGIGQEGCDEVSVATRGSAKRNDRAFAVEVGGNVRWQDGALTGTVTENSNLPPPVAIGARGSYYWRLARESDTTLLYTTGYSERGLFFLVPYGARVSTTCRLTAATSSTSPPLPAPPESR